MSIFAKPGGYAETPYEPGTKWCYSDAGPNWLAECLTLAYRRDLRDLMFERVFTPLGTGESGGFSTKWISEDGLTLHLVFSGDDHFSVRKAVLHKAAPAGSRPASTAADRDRHRASG